MAHRCSLVVRCLLQRQGIITMAPTLPVSILTQVAPTIVKRCYPGRSGTWLHVGDSTPPTRPLHRMFQRYLLVSRKVGNSTQLTEPFRREPLVQTSIVVAVHRLLSLYGEVQKR